MPWLRSGDNAATHPKLLAAYALSGGDVRAINEAAGFLWRCAMQSAGHTTDYVVDEGTALLMGMTEAERLVDLCVRAGTLIEQPATSSGRRWKIVDNDPDFIHMRLKDEIEWERQQREDNRNPSLIVPVRLRDGDQCRYCGRLVKWSARKGGIRGTYDHREPGVAATIDTLVVACGACNSGRRDTVDADERYPLRPPPVTPFYSESTAAFLKGHGYTVKVSTDTDTDTDTDPDPEPVLDPAPEPAAEPVAEPDLPDQADSVPTRSEFAGSGRDGSGRVLVGTERIGAGRVGAAREAPPHPPPGSATAIRTHPPPPAARSPSQRPRKRKKGRR